MNKKVFITYADIKFKKQKKFTLRKAKSKGGFDKTIGYSKSDIDTKFYEKNKHILEQNRGGGYWLWKPYFIVKTLEQLDEGDYLFYSDAGAFFLKNVNILINELEKQNQDIMGFELPLIEKQWTKKELFINMGCNDGIYLDTNQILASFILIKKSKYSFDFFTEFLNIAQNEINITDFYNNDIKQYDEFIDHRHDQSIFSLLYKKHKLIPFKDPSQFGKYPSGYSASKYNNFKKNKLYFLDNGRLYQEKSYSADYEQIIYHNRKLPPILGLIRYKLREVTYKLGLYNGLVR